MPTTSTHLIPAKRQIGEKGEKQTDWSGRGLIDLLAEHQNPGFQDQDKKAVFEKINAFLQVVTGKPAARIEIPADRIHILVHMDDKVLPLSSLGTGIHEVIMIAATCTLQDNEIICIEEPETHLHPVLQRKLIAYLQENTDNQYFIATHSASFIDMEGASVFHIENDGQQTYVRHVGLKGGRRRVCRELGYQASDLVQANSIIWVEGPSDRVYIKHWVHSVAPELVEGIHFSIMFYGGRLLSHLSADPESVESLIDLLALNQNSALIMDSDRAKPNARLNATKTRVIDEFRKSDGFSWVTKGREIENYIAEDILVEVLTDLHPDDFTKLADSIQFAGVLNFRRKADGTKAPVDKMKVARAVAEKPADLSPFGLSKEINKLIKFIREANGLN